MKKAVENLAECSFSSLSDGTARHPSTYYSLYILLEPIWTSPIKRISYIFVSARNETLLNYECYEISERQQYFKRTEHYSFREQILLIPTSL